MKRFFIVAIGFYRKFISPLLPRCCRYYPSCSEYALYEFKFNGLFRALCATAARILRCNPLFSGGIDYPIIARNFKFCVFSKVCEGGFNARAQKFKLWFIPYKKNRYYVIRLGENSAR
nr:membrane protein insertion efficiency factor YidD [uncultured Campylobacter sp.]